MSPSDPDPSPDRARRAQAHPSQPTALSKGRALRLQDQALSDADQVASGSDQASSDADRADSTTGSHASREAQQRSNRDQRASDVDQAAADQEVASAPRRSVGQLAVLVRTKAMRALATLQRAEVTSDRSATDAERGDQDRRRDHTSAARDTASDARDVTAQLRDQASAAAEQGVPPNDATEVELQESAYDRTVAASARTAAASARRAAAATRARELIVAATAALEASRELDRDAQTTTGPPATLAPDRDQQLLALLPGAFARGELKVHYQPIYELAPHDVVGFEALLRWISPTLGAVAPDEFIPIAESTGAIIAIGDWVLDVAMRDLAAWRAAAPDRHLTVAVNVAPEQLVVNTFAAGLAQRLADCRLPAAALTLEVTERTLVTDAPALHVAMEQLRALGVRLSVDDFGTGFSSLGRLASFPLDEIKIDRIFVSGLADDRRQRGLIAGIVAMSGALDLRVVAEGIETPAHCDTLIELGCDLGQGYLLGRPNDVHSASALITSAA